MPKAQKHHVAMAGYEVCIHTCNGAVCQSGGRGVWKKEGGSCLRHAKTHNSHLNCMETCPGYNALVNSHVGRSGKAREATRKELIAHLSLFEAAGELRRLGQPLAPGMESLFL